MPKRLLFISPANLTVNPRLLKELNLAVSQGFKVDFVGFKLGNWSDEIDKKLIKNIDANFHYISITRKPFLSWFINSVIEKIAQKIYPFFKKIFKINAYAHSKRSILLNNYLKKNKTKYDLIIAHVLPTLYPACKFAKRTNTKFIFDIEDYHPGEAIGKQAESEKARRIFLMKKLLPKAAYITYASPLIGEYSLKLAENYSENRHQLINNCFSVDEFQFKQTGSKKIKFVWFSQNIAAGRGLELVVPALEKFQNKIELHLIGNLYQTFYDDFLSKHSDFIKIHKPLPQKDLNLKLAEFDIGLAIEPGKDLNNNIAVSNKIWAYFQSGLYILASNTPAQLQFIEKHKNCGIIAQQNTNSFINKISEIIDTIDTIRVNKKTRFEYAKNFAWEQESQKLLQIWKLFIK